VLAFHPSRATVNFDSISKPRMPGLQGERQINDFWLIGLQKRPGCRFPLVVNFAAEVRRPVGRIAKDGFHRLAYERRTSDGFRMVKPLEHQKQPTGW